jgi:hypothetical protein
MELSEEEMGSPDQETSEVVFSRQFADRTNGMLAARAYDEKAVSYVRVNSLVSE